MNASGAQLSDRGCCLQVALDAWPEGFAGLEYDNLIANPDHVGSGFEVRENLIMNNRGRGILLKAGNGSVEWNTIFRPTFWPLQVLMLPHIGIPFIMGFANSWNWR